MGRPELPRVGEPSLMTVGQVAEKLGMSETGLRYRTDKGIFPSPTRIDDDGNRLFSQAWLDQALKIRAGEGK